MEQNKRKDPELVKVIDEAIASSDTYSEALEKVKKWEKENRGLIKRKIFSYTTGYLPPSEEIEATAKDFLMMHRACAEGNYRDATNDQL